MILETIYGEAHLVQNGYNINVSLSTIKASSMNIVIYGEQIPSRGYVENIERLQTMIEDKIELELLNEI